MQARVTVAPAAYSYVPGLFAKSLRWIQRRFWCNRSAELTWFCSLAPQLHKSVMSNEFIPGVCMFVSSLMHLRYAERMCACGVWLMCVMISQLANIYICTPSFVAYLDWQRCGPDWLVSLRNTWDSFVWLGTLKHGCMIKNYIAFISPLVGLNGFDSTSLIHSQVFAVLSTVELFWMAAEWRWIW